MTSIFEKETAEFNQALLWQEYPNQALKNEILVNRKDTNVKRRNIGKSHFMITDFLKFEYQKRHSPIISNKDFINRYNLLDDKLVKLILV